MLKKRRLAALAAALLTSTCDAPQRSPEPSKAPRRTMPAQPQEPPPRHDPFLTEYASSTYTDAAERIPIVTLIKISIAQR